MELHNDRIVTRLLMSLSTLFLARELMAQGSLSQIREDVRTPSVRAEPAEEESSPRRKKQKRCGHSYACDCDDCGKIWLDNSYVGAGVAVLAAPIWLPISLARDDYTSAGYFPEYPYQYGLDGYMMIDPWIPSEPFSYSWQARTEYATDFDDLSRIGTHVLIDTATRIGIDSEVNYWRESLAVGQHDDLWTGDANLLFRFAQADWMQMRTGLGMNWLADDTGTDLGFNFTYQGDFFPSDPWIISAEVDLGSLGDETLVHGRITTGVHWHRAEVFVGYDYYKVDRTELSGFVSGLRLWF